MYTWITGGFRSISYLGKNSEAPQKPQNFNFILGKSCKKKKVVFMHKNNSFFGLGDQKIILGGVCAKKTHFFHFYPDFKKIL